VTDHGVRMVWGAPHNDAPWKGHYKAISLCDCGARFTAWADKKRDARADVETQLNEHLERTTSGQRAQ
jgi:hypothetical protein